MENNSFYADLPVIDAFTEVVHPFHYTPAPQDWFVVISDVAGSTKAIEEGRYKEVNIVGASTVAAVLNIAGKTEVPFVFGGDGASFLLPPSLLEAAKEALRNTQAIAQEVFGLSLRVGIVPVSEIKEAEVRVAKLRISSYFNQALFTGGGFSYAEKQIKDVELGKKYRIEPELQNIKEPNFTGLTCRWNDIESKHGETVSILIKATNRDPKQWDDIYERAIYKVLQFYGDEMMHHPVALPKLKIALKNSVLLMETRIRKGTRSALVQYAHLLKAKFQTLLFYIVTKTGITFADINQAKYRELLIATVDYKKFDDALRLVISGTPEAREKLTSYLKAEHDIGNLVYGIHTSNRALMTCLVFERYGKQIHFIDSADGGYTLAAKQLKAQLSALQNSDTRQVK